MIITKYECFLEWRNDFKIINQVSSLMLLCGGPYYMLGVVILVIAMMFQGEMQMT